MGRECPPQSFAWSCHAGPFPRMPYVRNGGVSPDRFTSPQTGLGRTRTPRCQANIVQCSVQLEMSVHHHDIPTDPLAAPGWSLDSTGAKTALPGMIAAEIAVSFSVPANRNADPPASRSGSAKGLVEQLRQPQAAALDLKPCHRHQPVDRRVIKRDVRRVRRAGVAAELA